MLIFFLFQNKMTGLVQESPVAGLVLPVLLRWAAQIKVVNFIVCILTFLIFLKYKKFLLDQSCPT